MNLENKNLMFNSVENNSILGQIILDNENLTDYLVPQKKLSVQTQIEGSPLIIYPLDSIGNVDNLSINKNAITQLGDKIKIPAAYLQKLHDGETWEKNLFATTLNDHFDFKKRRTPVLLRASQGELKAYLSNSYERYNSVAVLGQFLESFSNNGLTLSQAYFDGIRYFVEVTNKNNPFLIGGEPHFFSIQYRNSDYGRGALDIKFMLIKQVCTNGMIIKSALRKIHKGRQINIQGQNFQLSEDTLNKETIAKKAIVRDVANYICSPAAVDDIIQFYDKANNIDIKVEKVIEKLPSVNATKKDVELIQNILMRNDNKTGTTTGGNVIRVANAVSYIANTFDNDQCESINKYREMSGNLIHKFVKN